MHLSILIQISDFAIWNKIKQTIHFDNYNTIMIHFNTQLLQKNKIDSIKDEFKQAIFTYGQNKGMDIYPFFCQIKYIIQNNIETDYILKIHTKTNDQWRNDLILPLLDHNLINSKVNTLRLYEYY